MKSHILMMGALAAFASCNAPKQADSQTESGARASRSLVVYYSQTGATAAVAQLLSQKTGAALDSVVAEVSYDGSFMQTIERCRKEMEEGILPSVKPLTVNLADYDTLYVGFPVWFGTVAPPMQQFLKSTDLSGKVIYPFCTFGSGGRRPSIECVKSLAPMSQIESSFGIRNARVSVASSELDDYLIGCGIQAGNLKVWPDFSESHVVSDDEKAVFQAACGNYQMPLGTPAMASCRKLDDRTQYEFLSLMPGEGGVQDSLTILVEKADAEGAVPEFIEVFR